MSEHYVAGRRVPAFFNGMATGADWMSAASFIGMAGTLYAEGYDGLAFITGWTGGYCLAALFLAPYLRKFGQFTIPDFLGARFGGNIPRTIGVIAAIICSFTYGSRRSTAWARSPAASPGWNSRSACSWVWPASWCAPSSAACAVTWTQVAQYVILIIAYMIPVVWLSMKHTGNPIPQIAYGHAPEKVTAKEKELNDPSTVLDRAAAEVRAIHKKRQGDMEAKLKALEAGGTAYLAEEKAKVETKLTELKAAPAPNAKAIEAAEKAVKDFPADPAAAKAAWKMPEQAGLFR